MTKNAYNSIFENIKNKVMSEHRIMTEKAFAEKLGVDSQRIKDIKRGNHKITLEIIHKLKEVFGIDPNIFFEKMANEPPVTINASNSQVLLIAGDNQGNFNMEGSVTDLMADSTGFKNPPNPDNVEMEQLRAENAELKKKIKKQQEIIRRLTE